MHWCVRYARESPRTAGLCYNENGKRNKHTFASCFWPSPEQMQLFLGGPEVVVILEFSSHQLAEKRVPDMLADSDLISIWVK